MENIDLSEKSSIELTNGHLLMVWHILSEKLTGLTQYSKLSKNEIRAVWALEDICEKQLIKNGFTGKPKNEWEELIEKAAVHVEALPVEFLD
ncbi:MAG: hypothetical protein AB2697_22845 [Candidatus Thiodiazotropha endolucinida]